MESPNGDPIKAPPSTSTSTPTSSPTHHSVLSVSPISNFLINLSPISSVKATRYTQRFSEIRIPTPPVFKTPRLDLQRETSFLESDKVDEAGSDVHGQCGNGANAILVTCLAEEVQFCSPPVCIEEYLADHMEVENCPNSASSHVQQANNFTEENIPRVNDANDGNLKDCRLMLPYQARPNLTLSSMDLVETAVDERDAERFDGSSELRFKNVNDQQCGTRRHLQFEAAMACKSTANLKSHSSQNVTEEADIKMPVSVTDLESLITFNVEPRGVSNHRQAISSDQSIDSWTSFCPSEFIRSTPHGGTLAISGPIPSGTGLHINNISRSVPMGSDLILSKKLADYMSSQEEKLNPGLNNNLAKSLNSCFIASAAGELHAHVDNYQQDNQGVEDISSDIFQLTDSLKPPCNYLHATFSEQQSAPSEGGMHTSESIDMAEELNQVSPKKKRKRAALSSEGEGCKHCNCKRSKCLKLYCECFAAGVYCVDSCACESCYNKIEYEDTVQDIRKQIENRNPTAFAPKIVKHATDSPANVLEDGNWATPASARHKRGCNCKKSKCLKKYCECYQAKVGCSDACRCEGCNNSFGKKAESMYQRAERWKNPSHCKLDTAETDTDHTKAGTVKQFSQRWEESAAISHLTPLSQPYSVAEAPSVSPSTRDCPKVFLAQLHPGSSLTSSASHIRWRHSPMSFTPQFYEDNDAHKLAPENAFTEIRKDNDMPEILKNNTTPTKAIKASSPNKKRVSPPQFPSHELMSSSSPGLHIGRKFVWQDVPSFPPLSPCSKSKEGITQMETDLKPDTQ